MQDAVLSEEDRVRAERHDRAQRLTPVGARLNPRQHVAQRGLRLVIDLQRRVGAQDPRRTRACAAARGSSHGDERRVGAAVGAAAVRGGGGALRDALTHLQP